MLFDRHVRPFVPGFRIRPQNDVPGFNLNENSSPSVRAWPDGRPPGTLTPPYPDAAPALAQAILGFPTPSPELLAQSAPPTGLPGFRARPQADVPGFRPRLEDAVPGFNRVAPPLTPTPGVEGSTRPVPPPLPAWLYTLVTMPLPQSSTAFDPRPASSIEPPDAEPWPSSDTPAVPADINTAPGATTARNADPQPAAQSAIGNAWPQPPLDGWPYAQASGAVGRVPWPAAVMPQPMGVLPTPSPRPVADSNFILANADDAGGPQAPQQGPLPQDPATQDILESPSGTGLTNLMLHIPGKPDREVSEQEFSQFIEAYRQLKETEARQLIWDQPPSQLPHASLGQALLQSSVETIVPGAHYQQLARQQLEAGNYLGAALYQVAAFLDALLSLATVGTSTALTAAGKTAAAAGTALFRRSFDSLSQLQRHLGRAPEGMQWHHIVEQSQAARFGQRPIQSVENIVAVPVDAHRRLNAFYSSKQPLSHPDTVRVWLRGQSFERQYEYGLEQLKRVLGY